MYDQYKSPSQRKSRTSGEFHLAAEMKKFSIGSAQKFDEKEQVKSDFDTKGEMSTIMPLMKASEITSNKDQNIEFYPASMRTGINFFSDHSVKEDAEKINLDIGNIGGGVIKNSKSNLSVAK